MSVELIHPWRGTTDYRYDYVGEPEVEKTLQAAATAWPRWAALTLAERGAHLKAIAREEAHVPAFDELREFLLQEVLATDAGALTRRYRAFLEQLEQVADPLAHACHAELLQALRGNQREGRLDDLFPPDAGVELLGRHVNVHSQ